MDYVDQSAMNVRLDMSENQLTFNLMYDVGAEVDRSDGVLEGEEESNAAGVSCNSKRMPPGKRRESLSRNIRAKSGKWFRQAK